MPLNPEATTVITAMRKAPPAAHGKVRDLRVRWALEEIGKPYRAELLDAFAPRADGYLAWQPFGQVPAFDDDGLRLFESGAILLYLGETDERLLPAAAPARWEAISWTFAALNSVEPAVLPLLFTDVIHRREPWAAPAREAFIAFARRRLAPVETALTSREWLAGTFSIADILMVTVLRQLDHTDELAAFPAIAAYKARGEARAAFRQALADQLADLGEPAIPQPTATPAMGGK